MKFEQSGIEGKVVVFRDLETVMVSQEILRGGQWDYGRVTYDHKFVNRDSGDIYYLRVQGVAIKGEIEDPEAHVQLLTPILGHYYYPHGIEYDEEFPETLVHNCETKLEQLKELLEEVEIKTTESLTEENITQTLINLDGVDNIGNLHLWYDDAGKPVLSCHLIVNAEQDHNAILNKASDVLRERYDIEHTTIQIDRETAEATGNEG